MKRNRLLVPYVFIIVFFLTVRCQGANWRNFYPYLNVNPDKLHENYPRSYEEAICQFDSILSKDLIDNYRLSDSSVASIELAQAIGGLFIHRWNLGKRFDLGPYVRSNIEPYFFNEGISDNEAIIRVLFKCYHKKLNGLHYDLEKEVQILKKYYVFPQAGYERISPEMERRENEIISNYRFGLLNINDTVDILYNRPATLSKKHPDWYYLTGIIESKYPESKFIDVRLLEITNEYKENFMLVGEDTLTVGDLFNGDHKGWLKRGVRYYNYHSNKEYRE